MKDYSLDNVEKKDFILNYEIKDNDIFIKYADGRRGIVPNNLENVQKIICKMEEQVIDSKVLLKVFNTQIKNSSKMVVICSILLGLLSLCSLANLVFLLTTGIVLGMDLIAISKLISSNIKYNDLNKNVVFLENQDIMKKKVHEDRVFQNLKVKTKDKLSKKDITFTINDVDLITMSELNDILDTIEYVDDFKNKEIVETKQKRLK